MSPKLEGCLVAAMVVPWYFLMIELVEFVWG